MALIAFILFILLAILGRVILQYRITGDHGLRPATRESSKQSKLLSIIYICSLLLVFLLTLFEALNILVPQIQLGLPGILFAILLCVVGTAVTLVSQYQMGTEWRIGIDKNEKTKLVTHGFYNYVRNPIYSGVMLFGLGLLIFFPHISMILALLFGYLGIELQVRLEEEPHLKTLHGSQFVQYTQSVNRYFPKLFSR